MRWCGCDGAATRRRPALARCLPFAVHSSKPQYSTNHALLLLLLLQLRPCSGPTTGAAAGAGAPASLLSPSSRRPRASMVESCGCRRSVPYGTHPSSARTHMLKLYARVSDGCCCLLVLLLMRGLPMATCRCGTVPRSIAKRPT